MGDTSAIRLRGVEPRDVPARRPRGPSRLKEADLVRVLKAAKKSDFPVAAVRIEVSGAIIVIPGAPESVPSSVEPNDWDD
jgi:hypothetical protein